ncbi:MAG: FAD-dependent oxidoreductase [Phycisphaerales bacterium]|nr:FAD-dependent oxidoreductase [Phycisphaerales bacterium]
MHSVESTDQQRVAIIGAGISGLVTAYLLIQRHDITLFESRTRIGGHTNTIQVPTDQGTLPVDTGFIVYNEHNYPLFTELLSQLKVQTQPSDMSFSVQCERTGLEYNGSSLNQLFARRRNLVSPAHWKMIKDILRFNKHAELLHDRGRSTTVQDYVQEHGFSEAFLTNYLIPIGASLWSCPSGTFRNFPIRFVIDFLRNHGMLQGKGRPEWRVVKGGSSSYIDPLTEPFADRIVTGSKIERVDRHGDRVEIHFEGSESRAFDHVVFACHSDQALSLIQEPTPTEHEILSAFPYQSNRTILHTDTRVLPKRKRAWGSWNYHIRRDNPDAVAITYLMNKLQSIESETQYCVTLNEHDRIHPDKIIKDLTYHHPIFTQERDQAQSRHHELIGPNRTSFCGAYWGYGFHEDGVRSGVRVAEHFGCTL